MGRLTRDQPLRDVPRVYFGVFNFGTDPQVVTDMIGTEPHEAWRKGESAPSGGLRTHDRWEFRGPSCERAPFDVQLDELLDFLEARAVKIRAVAQKFETGICCTASYYDVVNPGFHFSETAIRRIAELGLSCDLDLYMLGTDNVS